MIPDPEPGIMPDYLHQQFPRRGAHPVRLDFAPCTVNRTEEKASFRIRRNLFHGKPGPDCAVLPALLNTGQQDPVFIQAVGLSFLRYKQNSMVYKFHPLG